MAEISPSNELALAGLVHDLNNVFETISEAADLILADPQWTPVAEAILRSVESGRRIVGCYAGVNRPGADLDVVVERAATFLNDFLTHMPGVKVRLTRRVPPGLRLSGAPSDWERVFMNLFLNAAQAMRESGGGEVDISAHAVGLVAEIRIQDNGPGIPEAILAKIFKARFSTRNRQTGLGLHIVHSIVEQHNGSVRAENRSDARGAVFILSVPLIAFDSAD